MPVFEAGAGMYASDCIFTEPPEWKLHLGFHFIKHSSRVPLHLTFKILQRMLSLLSLLFLNFRQLLDLIFTFPKGKLDKASNDSHGNFSAF